MEFEKIDKTVRCPFVKTATVLQINVEAPAFVKNFEDEELNPLGRNETDYSKLRSKA